MKTLLSILLLVASPAALAGDPEPAATGGAETSAGRSMTAEEKARAELVEAARAAKATRNSTAGRRVITNADVKKSKGKIVETDLPPLPPLPPEENLLEAQAASRKADAASAAALAAAESNVATLEKELARLEQAYYEENDLDRRDTEIRRQFESVRERLEAARKELDAIRPAPPDDPPGDPVVENAEPPA